MSNLPRKTEVLANIAITIVALLLGVVLVKNYLLPRQAQVPTNMPPQIQQGEKVSLPDVDWSKADQTLLVVLSQGCQYCAESAGFYQEIIRQTNESSRAQIIAVFPQAIDEGKKFLAEHGLAISQIKQASFPSIKVRGTPTLILVNKEGVVKKTWVGKLPANQESEVLNEIFPQRAANCCN